MIKVSIKEASAHLSRYVADLREGETILLCKRNRAIAEIRPIMTGKRDRRPIGLGKGTFNVPDSFFEEISE